MFSLLFSKPPWGATLLKLKRDNLEAINQSEQQKVEAAARKSRD